MINGPTAEIIIPQAKSTLEKIACITSIGHSGSTLVGMLLNQFPEMTAVGEISNLRRFTADPDRRCACGVLVRECEFWQSVEAELRDRLRKPSLTLGEFAQQPEPKTTAFRYVPALSEVLMIAGSPTLWRYGSQLTAQGRREFAFGENAIPVYEAVAASRDTPIVVASTATTHMKLVYLADPRRFRSLHVVRDGRGWTCSLMRRENVGMEFAVRLWVRRHWNTKVLMRSIPARQRMRLRYEDLCLDPAGTMDEVARFLDVSTRLADFELRKSEFHGLGGNPMRFDYKQSTVQLDEKWRTEISPQDLELFERIGGKLNRSLGYR